MKFIWNYREIIGVLVGIGILAANYSLPGLVFWAILTASLLGTYQSRKKEKDEIKDLSAQTFRYEYIPLSWAVEENPIQSDASDTTVFPLRKIPIGWHHDCIYFSANNFLPCAVNPCGCENCNHYEAKAN